MDGQLTEALRRRVPELRPGGLSLADLFGLFGTVLDVTAAIAGSLIEPGDECFPLMQAVEDILTERLQERDIKAKAPWFSRPARDVVFELVRPGVDAIYEGLMERRL